MAIDNCYSRTLCSVHWVLSPLTWYQVALTDIDYLIWTDKTNYPQTLANNMTPTDFCSKHDETRTNITIYLINRFLCPMRRNEVMNV